MSVWAVLPVKPAEEGKSRLAEVLPLAKRIRLNRSLFRHTLGVVCSVFAPDRVIVVSRDSALLGIAAAVGAQALTEHGEGLNAALTQAALLPPPGADLLAISTDLPTLTEADLRAMLEQPGPVIIAPDRAGQGTNALLMRPAGCIPYRFGENSFLHHREEASQAGLEIYAIHRPGLAFDLDLPGDLPLCPAGLLG
jgi:2-phospho-L-lactate/phosphoenolpyruvate guanylyltransferase